MVGSLVNQKPQIFSWVKRCAGVTTRTTDGHGSLGQVRNYEDFVALFIYLGLKLRSIKFSIQILWFDNDLHELECCFLFFFRCST